MQHLTTKNSTLKKTRLFYENAKEANRRRFRYACMDYNIASASNDFRDLDEGHSIMLIHEENVPSDEFIVEIGILHKGRLYRLQRVSFFQSEDFDRLCPNLRLAKGVAVGGGQMLLLTWIFDFAGAAHVPFAELPWREAKYIVSAESVCGAERTEP